ncbi:UNVERIFIED_CONTAM: hypothetical protein FKN15_060194 [Acipenser sinensis]
MRLESDTQRGGSSGLASCSLIFCKTLFLMQRKSSTHSIRAVTRKRGSSTRQATAFFSALIVCTPADCCIAAKFSLHLTRFKLPSVTLLICSDSLCLSSLFIGLAKDLNEKYPASKPRAASSHQGITFHQLLPSKCYQQ